MIWILKFLHVLASLILWRGRREKMLGVPERGFAQRLMGLPLAPWDAVICVNGIFGSSPGWETEVAQWFTNNTQIVGSYFYYWCGLFKWGQAAHAAALAQMIDDLRAKGARKVHVIAHSNGCQLIRMALQISGTAAVDVCVLVAAADKEDCGPAGNGWNALLSALPAAVQRLIITQSSGDTVLAWNWLTPSFWGCQLGLNGPKNAAPLPLVCAFAALPTQPAELYTVGFDNSQDHLDWLGKNQAATVATLAAVLEAL